MITAADLRHVNLSSLRRRIQELGWTPMKRPGVYRAPDGRFFMVPIELDTELDFGALRSVVEALLERERVYSIKDLISRLEGKKEDVVFMGCELEGVVAGRLPLKSAPKFYELVTRYFKASTITLLESRNVTPLRRGSNLFDRLAYGETLEGSYLISVHVPVDTIPEPLGRLLVRKSVAAFQTLKFAVDQVNDNVLLESPEAGWSAVMCEAVIGFAERSEFREIKFHAAPDPVWDDGIPVDTEEVIVPLHTGVASEVLAEAAAKLRGLSKSQYVEVVGIPFASRDNAIIGEGHTRTVDILWQRENATTMKVKAELSQSAYEEALKGLSNSHIKAKGWLRQQGSRWVLEVDGQPTLLDWGYNIAGELDNIADEDIEDI